jgi:hypothetical protein
MATPEHTLHLDLTTLNRRERVGLISAARKAGAVVLNDEPTSLLSNAPSADRKSGRTQTRPPKTPIVELEAELSTRAPFSFRVPELNDLTETMEQRHGVPKLGLTRALDVLGGWRMIKYELDFDDRRSLHHDMHSSRYGEGRGHYGLTLQEPAAMNAERLRQAYGLGVSSAHAAIAVLVELSRCPAPKEIQLQQYS